jgi:PE family
MPFLSTQPDLLAVAASDLAGIGAALNAASNAAAAPTTGVAAAGADEVSAAVAALFGAHANRYQSMSAQAAALHSQFVQTMAAAGGAYASAEVTNALPL